MATSINAISTETRIPPESNTTTKQTENVTIDFTSVDEKKQAILSKVESYQNQIKVLKEKFNQEYSVYSRMPDGDRILNHVEIHAVGFGVLGGAAGTFALPIAGTLLGAAYGVIGGAIIGAIEGASSVTPEQKAQYAAKKAYRKEVLKPIKSQIEALQEELQEEMAKLQ